MKLLPFQKHQTPGDVRSCVERALAGNLPILTLAKQEDGTWEISYFLPPSVTRYEAIGALARAQSILLDE